MNQISSRRRTLKKKNLPTLQDVANAAKVSTATVSRCLNEPGKVSQKTRDRVMEAVNQLNYAPNFGARAIAANRTGIFGAVIPTMENAIFARGLEAFQQELVSRNSTMLVASSNYDPEQEAHHIRTLVGRGADGLLLIGFQRDPQIYEFLSDREIPVVTAWNTRAGSDQAFVGFDNFAASKKLVEQAIGLGHTSFAYIAAPTATNDRSRQRVSGAIEAIEEAGNDPAAMRLVETDYSIQNGRDALLQIIKADVENWPTLIICGNDVLAVGAIHAAKEIGLRIPDEISIIGFDDIELATVASPSLTTVHVPHKDMGRIAAEMLHGLVNEGASPQQIILETEIVMRESLGPSPHLS